MPRALPDFLIIGAQRCGSTTLFRYLAQHPDTRPPLRKEIHYFTTHYEKGIRWYRAHFPISLKVAPNWLTFEATPYYLFHPLAPYRVKKTLPSVRFVAILRDPVDRAISHYRLNVALGLESLPLEAAIDAEPDRVLSSFEDTDDKARNLHRTYSYMARGRYAEQLERWLSLFDGEKFHVIDFDDLVLEPTKTLSSLYDFLGLRPLVTVERLHLGYRTPAQNIPTVEDPLRGRLQEYFAPHDQRLTKLLGRRFRWQSRTS